MRMAREFYSRLTFDWIYLCRSKKALLVANFELFFIEQLSEISYDLVFMLTLGIDQLLKLSAELVNRVLGGEKTIIQGREPMFKGTCPCDSDSRPIEELNCLLVILFEDYSAEFLL